MKFIADLQIHSKYSRATSPRMVIDELARWAKIKGIQVMGTGDFTHPEWFKELKNKLIPAEPGLFVSKDDPDLKNGTATRFMLTAETSHIYSKNGKTRRVHLLTWAPSFESVAELNTRLSLIGNLKSDGRPILGLDSKNLLKTVLEVDPNCVVVPAHAWTPWFSVFGSMSGFDTLEECFEDLTPNIFAIETGLSSDPAMNWRLSQLDNIALVSNSDSHSPERIGREANIFNTELSFSAIINAIKSKDPKKFLSTIEFFPEEGRYHYDGHRDCQVSLPPEKTKKLKGLCPKCGRTMTIGVLNRIHKLADRPTGFTDPNRIPFKNLIPLDEIISDALGVKSKTKKVWEEYFKLCAHFKGELNLLLNGDLKEIAQISQNQISEGIKRMREGQLKIEPGYDGEYGKIEIFEKPKTAKPKIPKASLI